MIRYLFISMLIICFNANANTQQRKQFDRATQALKSNNIADFKRLSRGLQNYSLYHHLRYQYLKPRLNQVPSSEIRTFLKRYGKTYFGDLLRQNWLNLLADKGHWNTFKQIYTPQKSTSLQCHYVYARLMTQRNKKAVIKEAQKLWLVGKSQPDACTPVFKYLSTHGLISTSLLWKRIALAMQNGQLSLANYLAKTLGSADKILAKRWQNMYKKPAETLADFKGRNISVVRQMILQGIRRLAKKDFSLANRYWNTYKRRYSFSARQKGKMQADLALASKSMVRLKAVNKKYLTDKMIQTRIKLALQTQQWREVANFIKQMPSKQQKTLQWRYWLARALEKTGKKREAGQIYKTLAKERDYYGFLAANRIGAKYQMQHHSIGLTWREKKRLLKNPSIAAAYEFDQIGQKLNARREWGYAMKQLSFSQQAKAAALASRWQWHDQAIRAAAKARRWDDLNVRFPLAYRRQLTAEAKRQHIDLSWVYGIIRQETAFRSTARSPVGALGLMQLMPATGKLVAKKIGVKLKKTQDILNIDTNIKLGIAYLVQMLEKFDGNYMLATAAYNAGPGRATRWAAKNECIPADIWVELIPFNETRKYVRNVLFYTRVFEYRLQEQTHPLRLADTDNCGM